jgi:hypothetical protein
MSFLPEGITPKSLRAHADAYDKFRDKTTPTGQDLRRLADKVEHYDIDLAVGEMIAETLDQHDSSAAERSAVGANLRQRLIKEGWNPPV